MVRSVCAHVERFKQQGGIRDYEKILLNLCIACPQHLKMKREQQGIKIMNRSKCQVKTCGNDVGDWNMYFCLHCVFVGCKDHSYEHMGSVDPPHCIGCLIIDGSVFCFACKDFVFDGALERMRETVQYGRCSVGGNVIPFTQIALAIKPTVMCIDSRSTVGLRGLVNLKNTCYMNCIIQVLAHTPILADFFLSECFELDCNELHSGKPCLMSCMTDVFRQFYNGSKSPIVLTELLEKMWRSAPHLASCDQQDAHEFLTAILEGMGRHFVGNQDVPCAIEGIFYGTLKSTVKCLKCLSESITMEKYMEISLEVFGDKSITLDECLLRYTQVETLSHMIYCESCGMNQTSSKQLELLKVPLILCMHFKRFQNVNHNKWNNHISFSKYIDLLIYSSSREEIARKKTEMDACDMSAQSKNKRMKIDFKNEICLRSYCFQVQSLVNEDFEYSLYAVVSHLGSSEGGHYITYFRNTHNTWFLCDDHTVSKVSSDEVLNCQAYMLFYHRTQLPQRPKSYSSE
ncbi:ubiquitin carboxyl-terminal hydrolase 27 isoform X2 [Folsomia candida]|uniref:ubiquitin carboxyl-terminal hydrolase 27 isoform X2 n=1 Tax=Folsomia candida TaxID=158441 RepID=UPI001604C003|nr:ubiquitin carboxyl-terminal hydrolase 27 isoform X2 [Folsomia candida]